MALRDGRCVVICKVKELESSRYLELELESGPAKIHEAADDPDEHGVPGQHCGAARGDGDEAGEDPVAQRGEVPDVVELLAGEHGDHPAEGGGERGADGGARGGGGAALGSDGEGRARVEAVPWGEGGGGILGGGVA